MGYEPAWGQNVVIVNDNQNTGQIKYRMRCPQCGTVSNVSYDYSITSKGSKFYCPRSCEKCHANIDAYIQRGQQRYTAKKASPFKG